MGRDAFGIVDGIRSARLGAVLGSGEPLFWPHAAPTCSACGGIIEFEDAHSYTDGDNRLVHVHRDCCPLCTQGGW